MDLKYLLLMRHATPESVTRPGGRDRDRPLTDVGLQEAAAIGRMIKDTEFIPDIILASSAKRTSQTAKALAEALAKDSIAIHETSVLYGGGEDSYLTEIVTLPDSIETALVIGHNPVISSLAQRLRGTGEPLGYFQPGALALLSFRIEHWAHIEKRQGLCAGFFKPDISVTD